jgi:MFS family permease
MHAKKRTPTSTVLLLLLLLFHLSATTRGFQQSIFSSAPTRRRSVAHIQQRQTFRSSSKEVATAYYPPWRSRSLLPASAIADPAVSTGDDEKLPPTVIPILLSVLALIVSEGVALSTLPLHLTSMGATPVQVGLSTSAFSIAQMVCCPLIVSLSSRIGRRKVLRLCLLGAAMSSSVIAFASTIPAILAARFLAGVFAAVIPVAQAGVTDLVPVHQTAVALSRVSAASQTGLVIGPIASALVQGLLARAGVASKYTVRGVFAASAAFALFALAVSGGSDDDAATPAASNDAAASKEKVPPIIKAASESATGLPLAGAISKHEEYAQPLLRVIALAAGWALTLSVSTYSLFASKFLGYAQPELSAAMSAGAATTIATQILIVPRLVKLSGEHLSCTLGLWVLTMGLAGSSLLRVQPLHTIMYLLIRVGQGITDTATATLVARASNDREDRARNLGMVQSTRAAARIFTPVVSGSLFSRSCLPHYPLLPGSLPYLVNAGLAFALTPLPLVLKRMEKKSNKSQPSDQGGGSHQ